MRAKLEVRLIRRVVELLRDRRHDGVPIDTSKETDKLAYECGWRDACAEVLMSIGDEE